MWRRPRLATTGWLFCWIVILFAGLWPLRFHVANGATWLQSENGLSFNGHGEAHSTQSLANVLGNRVDFRAQGFSLELLLRPARQTHPKVAYILSQEGPDSKPALLLFQYGSTVLLQTQFYGVDNPTFRKLGAGDVLVPGKLRHIALVSSGQGTILYVNGRAAIVDHYEIAVERFTGPFVLGNSVRADYPWAGDLLGFAAFDYARTGQEIERDATAPSVRQWNTQKAAAAYEFTEGQGEWAKNSNGRGVPLRIPHELIVLHRTMLTWHFNLDRAGLWDIAVNVAGFVPFGFLGGAFFVRRLSTRTGIVATILAGFLLSLLIEVTQAYLPFRDSSSIDVLTNTLGTAVGAACLLLGTPRQHDSAKT
jgi:VanZ like family/Concanavalin A-like lectin/glucanases superfamily